MRVFVGSSSKGADDLKTVCDLLANAELVPLPWSEPGLFQLGLGTWEGLVELTRNVDAAAFIFREDDELREFDKALIREGAYAVTRDNVVLECGLFTGVLGRQKCAVFVTGKPRIPSDLKGVTHIRLDDLERRQSEVDSWKRKLVASKVLPPPFTLNQIGAICNAMTGSGIPMNRVYTLMERWGVGTGCVNEGIQKNTPTT